MLLQPNAFTPANLSQRCRCSPQDLTTDVYAILCVYVGNISGGGLECNRSSFDQLQTIQTQGTIANTDVQVIILAIQSIDVSTSVFCSRLGSTLLASAQLLNYVVSGGQPSNRCVSYPSPSPNTPNFCISTQANIGEESALAAAANASAALAALAAAEAIAAEVDATVRMAFLCCNAASLPTAPPPPHQCLCLFFLVH
jgi:hypothetical protein